MSYRPRSSFDRPTAETIRRAQRTQGWVIPLMFVQAGWTIFGHEGELLGPMLATAGWAVMTLAVLWWSMGLPVGGLRKEEQAILNDEWDQSARGDAAKWALVAIGLCGCVMMFARFWIRIDAGISIYVLVNGALVVAIARYWWLNRSEPDVDE